jgi:hypothetical protein
MRSFRQGLISAVHPAPAYGAVSLNLDDLKGLSNRQPLSSVSTYESTRIVSSAAVSSFTQRFHPSVLEIQDRLRLVAR